MGDIPGWKDMNRGRCTGRRIKTAGRTSRVPMNSFVAPAQVAFTGDRGTFSRPVMKGAALELITFGFYRFWLVTDIRRRLWSNASIDGDAVEHNGCGKELLIGFFFAVAILAPISLACFLVGIEAERYLAFASIPLAIACYAFGQFAIYRAQCYRLTRTMWRGVRFWMDGSGWAYSLRATLWGLLVLLTFGLALPWRDAALERYKMQHSYYGELRGDFEGEGWEFFKRGWRLWLSGAAAAAVYLVSTIYFFISLSATESGAELRVFALPGLVAMVLVQTIIVPPLTPLVHAEFKARQWSWWLSGIRIGQVGLQSTLPHAAFYGLYGKVTRWLLVLQTVLGYVGSAFIFAPIGAQGVDALIDPEGAFGMSPNVLAVVGYIAWIGFNIVIRIYLQRNLWGKVLESTIVHDIEAATDVQATGEPASALSEGFADGIATAWLASKQSRFARDMEPENRGVRSSRRQVCWDASSSMNC